MKFNRFEIKEAATILKSGGLIAFPTETVYGLGANAFDEDSIKKVFQVKGRPKDNPLIVHIDNFYQIKNYILNLHPLAKKLIKHFWPGPLALIFQVKPNIFPLILSGGLKTIAFRVPDHCSTLSLIKQAGFPLVGPSANISGKPSATTFDHVYEDLQGKISGILEDLEDNERKIGIESTVLDLSNPKSKPIILRPGAVTKEDLEEMLNMEVFLDKDCLEKEHPKSPGMKYKHYSPDTDVQMVKFEDWKEAIKWSHKKNLRVGILANKNIVDRFQNYIVSSYIYKNQSIEAASKDLFAGLRFLDNPKLKLDTIFVETFPEKKMGMAYMNRLKKSSDGKFFIRK